MTSPPPVVEGRVISGASAVLLPMEDGGGIDWEGFEAHLGRTVAAGLTPAVNMDTGFGPYLSDAERAEVLRIAHGFEPEVIAGVHSDDEPGATFDLDALIRAAGVVAATGALPIVFPSHGMATLSDEELVDAHRELGDRVGPFLGFELGAMFHPAGRIFSTAVFEALLGIPEVVGLKHSSLRRDLEWDRLRLCQAVRPDFRMMTGNDLAIDLVIHGSDYLLGLSTFAPDAFAVRDAAWASGDFARFWELNDLLQYLGLFAFRAPVPGYRHDAAMFLELRGWADSHATHPRSPARPESDLAVLADIAGRLDVLLGS
jgi:dihydrodipicolinate synthase/N-acetylneuraminate lyase